MDNVIPIRPGIQVPGPFSVMRPSIRASGPFSVIRPVAIRPARQAAQPAPMSLWKLGAIVVGTIIVYEGVSYLWYQR